MKSKIIMRSLSLIVGVISIYIIFLYEPKIEGSDNSIVEAEVDNTIETVDNNIELSDQKEVIQGYKYDVLSINLGGVVENLTTDEKNIVKGILCKLSVVDCAKVNSILNSSSIEHQREALLFIKKRILEEDYRRLEGILNQYMDLV